MGCGVNGQWTGAVATGAGADDAAGNVSRPAGPDFLLSGLPECGDRLRKRFALRICVESDWK